MTKSPSGKELRFAVVAVDAVCFCIVDGQLSVLVGKVNVEPHYRNRLGLIGGLISPEEDADQAVERHLHTKAGLAGVYKEQLYTFSAIDRDPRNRVISVAYLCLTPEPLGDHAGTIETVWRPMKSVSGLAYDHDEIVAAAVERLRSRIGYTNIAQYLLPKEFTLTDLQKTYEIILDRTLDKRNFRKKVHEAELVRATQKKVRAGASRPALLYKFSSRRPTVIDIL